MAGSAQPADSEAAAESITIDQLSGAVFARVVELAHRLTGIQLDEQKRSMLFTRLTRRLRAQRLSSFDAYVRLLESGDSDEQQAFINAVTTNLTYFFREEHHFDYLRDTGAPELLSSGRRPLRLWSAGCSSGEEPYSLAMSLIEAGLRPEQDFRVLCTDLNTEMVEATQRGVYRSASVRGLSDARLKTFFKHNASGMIRARGDLRQSLICRQLNLFGKWPVRSGVDIVFCRNVLIYFSQSQQLGILRGFARLQNPGALLFLGHSESIREVEEFYERVGHTIFRRLVD